MQSGFPKTCQQCHSTTTWTSATFDHATTGFPLTGAHSTVQCAPCHVNGNYNLTTANTTCVSCHLKDFQGATSPNHVQSGFLANLYAVPQHDYLDGRELRSLNHRLPADRCAHHRAVRAVPREQQLQLTSANTDCVSCHLKDFQGTTNPNHVQSGLPADLPAVPQYDLVEERDL